MICPIITFHGKNFKWLRKMDVVLVSRMGCKEEGSGNREVPVGGNDYWKSPREGGPELRWEERPPHGRRTQRINRTLRQLVTGLRRETAGEEKNKLQEYIRER